MTWCTGCTGEKRKQRAGPSRRERSEACSRLRRSKNYNKFSACIRISLKGSNSAQTSQSTRGSAASIACSQVPLGCGKAQYSQSSLTNDCGPCERRPVHKARAPAPAGPYSSPCSSPSCRCNDASARVPGRHRPTLSSGHGCCRKIAGGVSCCPRTRARRSAKYPKSAPHPTPDRHMRPALGQTPPLTPCLRFATRPARAGSYTSFGWGRSLPVHVIEMQPPTPLPLSG